VVQLGNREFAIPVEQVRGVVRHETLTRVPGAPDMVRGIVNVRGSVVTVLELSVLLRAERAVTAPSIVLLEHGTRLVGITVDAVRDVRIFEPSVVSATLDGNATDITPLDAVALCAPHLLSSEEMGP
jgi:purine-binding chemotaxis protein CheW